MAAFRTSAFIDFDTGVVRTPPMVLQKNLPPRDQQSMDQMLLLFECRVDVWKFGPAVEMLKAMDVAYDQTGIWAHSGYALLDVTCSYFEMVGKVLNSDSRTSGTAGLDFNYGFCDVYQEFGAVGSDRSDAACLAVAGQRVEAVDWEARRPGAAGGRSPHRAPAYGAGRNAEPCSASPTMRKSRTTQCQPH